MHTHACFERYGGNRDLRTTTPLSFTAVGFLSLNTEYLYVSPMGSFLSRGPCRRNIIRSLQKMLFGEILDLTANVC